MSYSQNDEEHFILEACPPIGRFLDIGAWGPFDKSNTRALYDLGWGGVLVEPSPGPFTNLFHEYGDSRQVSLIRAAVVLSDISEVEMWITDDMVSTTEDSAYQKWKDTAHFNGLAQVPAITLDRIFEFHGNFDFVSIDAEGTSVDLLKRLLDMGKRPKCICVEYDDRADEALSSASTCGYVCVYTSGENLVLVR